jgi:hypothetical protein
MSENFRHHRVSREIIIIEVEAGSPKSARTVKPGKYPADKRQPWTGPPTKRIGKAEALARFLRRVAEQDQIIREYMKPDAAGLAAWLNRTA